MKSKEKQNQKQPTPKQELWIYFFICLALSLATLFGLGGFRNPLTFLLCVSPTCLMLLIMNSPEK